MVSLPDYFEEPEWLRVSRLCVETLIAFFGVLGNIGVIIAISRCSFMRSVTNMFIRNLAIADIGVLVLSFPFAVVKEQTLYHWPLGKEMCRVVYPLSEIFIGVSVWSMVIISIDRYRGIVNDSHLRSVRTAILICCLTWLASFIVITLPLLIVTRFWEEYGYKSCIHKWPQEHRILLQRGYTILSSVYNYVLPLSIISWTYYKIFRKIGQSDSFNKNNLDRNNLKSKSSWRFEMRRIKRNNRARKILTPVVVVFAVALLPVNVFRVMLVFLPSLITFRYLWVIYNVCIITTVLNSSCNPIIYALVSDNFRVAFKTMFKSRRNFPNDQTRSSYITSGNGAAFRLREMRDSFKRSSSKANPSICSRSSLAGPV